MSNNTTSHHTPATLSERELFAEFLQDGITLFNRSGRITSTISADEMFTPYTEVLEFLSHGFDHLRDQLEQDESPSLFLELAEGDLLDAARQIAMVRKHFEDMKYERQVDDDETDEGRFSAHHPIVKSEVDLDRKGEAA